MKILMVIAVCFAGAAVFAVRKRSSRSVRTRLYADADAALPHIRVGKKARGWG